jgi:hypothetical protein
LPKLAAGADGVLLKKKGPIQEFKANLGVVVTVADPEQFQEDYSLAIKKTCLKYKVKWNRPYCRAADLRFHSDSDQVTLSIIQDLVKEVGSEVKQVHIVYTMLFPSSVPKVYTYTAEPPIISETAVDFQDKLAHPYPYLCLWAYSKVTPGLNRPLMCDHFAGELTIAWEELEKQCPPRVFFDGGNTNALVSLSDILLRLLDSRFGQLKLNDILNPDRLPQFLPEFSDRLQAFYLGQKFIRNIVPLRRQKIDLTPHIAHPILYIVKEPTSVQTSDFISRTAIMDDIYTVAAKLGGCVHFFEQRDSNDQRLISPGDFFLWTGEHGKRFIESLPSLRYKDLRMGEIGDINRIAAEYLPK